MIFDCATKTIQLFVETIQHHTCHLRNIPSFTIGISRRHRLRDVFGPQRVGAAFEARHEAFGRARAPRGALQLQSRFRAAQNEARHVALAVDQG